MAVETLFNKTAGLNNNIDPAVLPQDQTGKVFLSGCNNVVVGDSGRIERCLGKVINTTMEGVHSLTSTSDGSLLVWVLDSVMYCGSSTYQLSHNGSVSYAVVGNYTIFSNGTDRGLIKGDRILTVPDGIYDGPDTAKSFTSMPVGHIVEYTNGLLAVAADNVLWLSEPRNPFLFNRAEGMFQYKSRIRMIAPMPNGFWISDSNSIYYVSGAGNGNWEQTKKADFPAYEGKPAFISVDELPLDNLFGTGYLCPTTDGICLLGPDGIFINLTSQTLELRKKTGERLKLEKFCGAIDRNKYHLYIYGEENIGLIFNIRNLALTQQCVYSMNTLAYSNGSYYGAFKDGIYSLFELWPRVDSEFSFYWNPERRCRLRFLHIHGEFYGDIGIEITSDENVTVSYTGELLHDSFKQHEFRVPVNRINDIGSYFKIKVKNLNGRYFAVNKITADVVYRR